MKGKKLSVLQIAPIFQDTEKAKCYSFRIVVVTVEQREIKDNKQTYRTEMIDKLCTLGANESSNTYTNQSIYSYKYKCQQQNIQGTFLKLTMCNKKNRSDTSSVTEKVFCLPTRCYDPEILKYIMFQISFKFPIFVHNAIFGHF